MAAITRGREWLGRATKAGSVLLCTEMHVGDVKRTLRQFDADLTRVYVCRPEELSEHVQRAPDDLVLVVVDTLTTYAEAIGITKLSDPITAKKLMMTLRRAVFGSRPEVSLHVQHHNRKAPVGVDEAEARDSTAIMGDADQVISMLDGEKGDPPTIRRLRATGRWSEPGATVRLAGDGFEIVSTDDPLDTDPTGGGGGVDRFDRPAVVEYMRCARPPHALRPCRVTRRPSLRSESNYGPCGPAGRGRPGRQRLHAGCATSSRRVGWGVRGHVAQWRPQTRGLLGCGGIELRPFPTHTCFRRLSYVTGRRAGCAPDSGRPLANRLPAPSDLRP